MSPSPALPSSYDHVTISCSVIIPCSAMITPCSVIINPHSVVTIILALSLCHRLLLCHHPLTCHPHPCYVIMSPSRSVIIIVPALLRSSCFQYRTLHKAPVCSSSQASHQVTVFVQHPFLFNNPFRTLRSLCSTINISPEPSLHKQEKPI